MTALLELKNISAAYGASSVIHDVSMVVADGGITALLGANGAGKTTLIRAISGVQPISSGRILLDGRAIERMPAHARVALGIAQVPEGRQLFAPLAVEDNLKLGAWTRREQSVAADLAEIYALFPMLAERRHTAAGALSGGQQQVLAIGRALMAKPRLLLLDEPSMGLAPILVEQIFEVLRGLQRRGLTVLLVEQNARAALAIAQRSYVLETGRITVSGTAADVSVDPRVREAYLGV
jgi:branched-chain amino acid transport system ATP-binding protein